jgi:hypothetical protein
MLAQNLRTVTQYREAFLKLLSKQSTSQELLISRISLASHSHPAIVNFEQFFYLLSCQLDYSMLNKYVRLRDNCYVFQHFTADVPIKSSRVYNRNRVLLQTNFCPTETRKIFVYLYVYFHLFNIE